MNITTKIGTFRRYILWISYDGSRFPEMATGPAGYGVIDSLQQCLRSCINPIDASIKNIFVSPSSRTDAHVHAIRTSVLAHIPIEKDGGLDDTISRKQQFSEEINQIMGFIDPDFKLLDFQSVHPGFCARKHVSYRRYVYRIIVPKSYEIAQRKPNVAIINDRLYSWMLYPHFNPEKASKICEKFQGVHNIASFFKHSERDRIRDPYFNTLKFIQQCSLNKGEGYCVTSNDHDYYNINIISRSFVRQQIRRMVAAIVAHAYGQLSENDIDWLLNTPDPRNYFRFRGLKAAPPEGLFLADVTYNPIMFINPNPIVQHSWDYIDNDCDDFVEDKNE